MTGATWTADEIQRLKAAVALYGPPTNAKQWRTIGDAVGTRNGRKCQQKWENLTLKTPEFTAEHDRLIQSRVEAGLRGSREGWANGLRVVRERNR